MVSALIKGILYRESKKYRVTISTPVHQESRRQFMTIVKERFVTKVSRSPYAHTYVRIDSDWRLRASFPAQQSCESIYRTGLYFASCSFIDLYYDLCIQCSSEQFVGRIQSFFLSQKCDFN